MSEPKDSTNLQEIDSEKNLLFQQKFSIDVDYKNHQQRLMPSPVSSIGSRRNVPTPLSFPVEPVTESPFSSAGLSVCSSLLVSIFWGLFFLYSHQVPILFLNMQT